MTAVYMNLTTEFNYYTSIRLGFMYTKESGFSSVYEYTAPRFVFKRPRALFPDAMSTEVGIKVVLAPSITATIYKLVPIKMELQPGLGSTFYFDRPVCREGVPFYQLWIEVHLALSIEPLKFEFAGTEWTIDFGGVLPCMPCSFS